MPSMVTCITWVSRGVAKTVPDKVELSQEELEQLINETKDKIIAKEGDEYSEGKLNTEISNLQYRDQEQSDNSDNDENTILQEYNLDNYDDEGEGVVLTGAGMAGLTYFLNNDDDPYITLKNSDDEEKEDLNIKPTDNLIIIGKVEDEFSNLEIHVYNEDDNDLYVHHDIMLDSFPLALEWLGFDAENDHKQGNMVAVGTMEPYINIWDLDVIDAIEPVTTLGRKKKSKKKSTSQTGHVDAVLDLSWNKNTRNILCSGSADSTVVLWDLAESKCVNVLIHHSNKVQTVSWHPYEAQLLLTGSFDRTAQVADCRSPEASTDKGNIYCCDVRSNDPVFTLNAHDEAVTGISFSKQLPGCLTSVSQDKMVKVWDIENNTPSFVVSRDMKMGSILNISSCPDSPYVFALGGEKQGLQLFDIIQSAPASKHFENRQCLMNVTTRPSSSNGDEMLKAEPGEISKEEENMDIDAAFALKSLSLDKNEGNVPSAKKIVKKKKKKRK